MITASRLATEKHIDWLVRAVVRAKKELPELSFDIYGKGGEEGKLRSLIDELGAADYIHLKGHANLEKIYKNYEVYLSASTSEGFGLTLMEAIGSGLPIIGFDVPLWQPDLCHRRGKWLSHSAFSRSSGRPDRCCLCGKNDPAIQKDDLASMRQASYARAEDFLTSRVEEAWAQLIEEVTHAERIW